MLNENPFENTETATLTKGCAGDAVPVVASEKGQHAVVIKEPKKYAFVPHYLVPRRNVNPLRTCPDVTDFRCFVAATTLHYRAGG